MSEVNTTADNAEQNVPDTPKAARKRAPKAERQEFSKIIRAHAKRRGIDDTRAGKELRAKARREFATLVKLDPSLAKAKTHANDGNRWPPLNDKCVTRLLARKVAK